MEAIPRLPMLSFDLKRSPEYVEFGPVLKQYIKTFYGEDAANYNKACSELEQLRQDATQVVCDYMGCTILKRYYAQLQFLQGRFPMGEGEDAAIAFTWEDVQTGRDHIGDIKFEQAAILYNIGSLHSLLGVLDTRHNAEGMKVSCTHFQCAAWAFEYLRDNFGNASASTDMSFELLSFHILLMLAQAQECILEKSMLDGRKNSITAKVAAQVVDFYRQAIKAIDISSQKQQINSRMHKEWRRRMEMKEVFYQCITYYYQGQQVSEASKPGECLAYFTGARDKLTEAFKLAKNEVSEVSECLQRCQEVVVARYNAAKKDNDFVYHDKVPSLDSLPEIKGASLVKGIPFNPTDKEISGPHIFHKLVPLETHQTSSVYSEEKAKLARTVNGEIEGKDMELNQFMSSLHLDMDQFMPKADTIPESLMEKCAAMSVRTNAIKELTDSMAGVSGLATEVELAINEIQELIDQDTTKTEQFEEQYGRKKSNTVLPGLLKESEAFREQHKEATQLNNTLYRAMNAHTNNLKTLILPPVEVEKLLPQSTPELSPEEEAILSEVINLMRKVTTMKEQRAELQEKFREQIHNDDITNVILTHEGKDKEAIFAEQLKKHDDTVKLLRQNMTAQDNILRALTDANAKFAVIRRVYDEAKERRQSKVNDLILSYEKYEELLAKAQRGEDYNRKLLEKVMKTLERCQSECKVRQEERDMLVAHYAPKAPAPSRPLAPKPNTSSLPNTPVGDVSVPDPTMSSVMPPINPALAMTPESIDPSLPATFQSLPTAFEGPKLKDYLPFMKPRSFGPKSQALTQDSAMPPSPGAPPESPQPSLDYLDSGKAPPMPGLDPSLSSILPITIAQYLASVSASSTSSPMSSTRHTPSPQGGSYRHPSQNASYPGMNPDVTYPQRPSPSQSPHASPSRQVTKMPQGSQYPQYGSVAPASVPAGMVPPNQAVPARPPVSSYPTSVGQGGNQVAPQSSLATSQYSVPHQAFPPTSTQAINPQQPHQQQQPQQNQYVHPGQYSSNQKPGLVHPPSSMPPASQGMPGQDQTRMPNQALPYSPYNQQQHMARPSQPLSQHQPQMQQPTALHTMPSGMHQQAQRFPAPAPSPALQQQQQPQQQVQPTQQQQMQPQMNPQWAGVPNVPTSGSTFSTPSQPHGQGVTMTKAIQPASNAQFPAQNQSFPYQGQVGHPLTQHQHQPQPQQPQGQRMQPQGYLDPHLQGQQSQQGHYQKQLQSHQVTSQNQSVPQPSHQSHIAQMPPRQNQSVSGVIPTPQPLGQPQGQAMPGQGHPLPPHSQPVQYPGQTSQGQPMQGQFQGQVMNPQSQPRFSQPQGQPLQPQGQTAHPQGHPLPHQSQLLHPQGQTAQHQSHTLPHQGQPPQLPGQTAQPQGHPLPAQGQPLSFQGQPSNFQGQPMQPQSQHPPYNVQQAPATAGSPYSSPVKNAMNSQSGPHGTYAIAPHSQGFHQPAQPSSIPQAQLSQNIVSNPQGQQAASSMQPAAGQGYHPQSNIGQGYIPTQGSQVTHTSQNPTMNQSRGTSPAHSNPMTSAGQGVGAPSQQQSTFNSAGYPSQMQPASKPTAFGAHAPQSSFPTQATVPQVSSVMPSGQTRQSSVNSPGQWMPGPYSQQLSNLPNPTQTPQSPFHQSQQSFTSQEQIKRPSQDPPLTLKTSIPPKSSTPASADGSVSTPPIMVPPSPQPSSLDELLSSSPNGVKDRVIAPQVLTDQERQLQKEEAMKNQANKPAAEPYSGQSALLKLVADVEAFSKHVDDLSLTILGVSRLDSVWKSLLDNQDSQSKKISMAIARCYPMKNRDPDIMPYDDTRVVLTSSKDDYINASWLNDLAPSCPKFIITQSPLPVTTSEFWTMVYEQGSEVLVQMTSEYETGKKFPVYYPTEKDKTMEQGPMLISLQSVKFRLHWVERILYMKNTVTKQGRTVVHLLFKGWPVSGFPEDVRNIVSFISEVHSFYKQQRSLTKPIIVHCGTGVGRSGIFVLVYAAIQELLHGNGLIDLPGLCKRILQKRRGILLKKEQLHYAYKALLCFAEDYLIKRGMPVKSPRFQKAPSESKESGKESHSSQHSHAADDIVLGSVDIETIRENVGRFHISKEKEESKKGNTYTDNESTDTPTAASLSLTSLPDVVQQHSESHFQPSPSVEESPGDFNKQQYNNRELAGTPESTKLPSMEISTPTHDNVDILRKMSQCSGSSETMQPDGVKDATGNGSTELKDSSTVSSSLAQLQDPATFTLGSPEKKNRITKTNFGQEEGSLLKRTTPDSSDPLASLDPLWSLGK